MLNTKFMQTLDSEVYNKLKAMAKERGVSVQELVRAKVIPDWLRFNNSHRKT